MLDKKEEHDTLQNLSEKDLWCQDLDAFVKEWETQLKEDADYQKTIRNTNRRVSRKIGAGKNVKSRAKKEDEDFAPTSKPLKANPSKGVVKVEHKTHKGFLEMFNAPKPLPKSKPGSDGAEEAMSGMSDDDFAALEAVKPAITESSRAPSEQPANGRSKRAAAAAPKKWIVDEDSESDDSKYLGDVGDMVKGIGGGETAHGRVSLFAMSGSSHGNRATNNDLSKAKSKASKPFDLSDGDETNYEMLARSSPHKAAPTPKDTLDSFLSDEDDIAPIIPKKAPTKAAIVKAPVAKVPAKRGPKPKAPALEEPTPAPEPEPKPKPVALSPAAKAYAAKQSKMNLAAKFFSEDEDDDIEMNDSPAPKPATKQTKTKAPAKKAVLLDDEDNYMEVDDSPPPKPVAKPAAKQTKARAPARKVVLSDDEDNDMGMDDSPPPKPAARPAAKQTKSKAPAKKAHLSDDNDDDVDMDESPPPKPAGRSRPARAAVAKAKASKPIYIDSNSDDDGEEDFDASAAEEEEQSEDDFDDSD